MKRTYPIINQAQELPKWRESFEQYKEKYPDAVLLFRHGDFYKSFKEDAEKVASIAGLFLGKYSDGCKQTMFPMDELDNVLPKIIRAGHRVAII